MVPYYLELSRILILNYKIVGNNYFINFNNHYINYSKVKYIKFT